MGISGELILTYAAVLFLLYGLGRVFTGPLRQAFRLLLYFALGVGMLLGANWLGGLFGARLAVNPFNALVAGLLNLPGIALLFLLRYWL